MISTNILSSLVLLVLYSLSIHLGVLSDQTLPALLVIGLVISIIAIRKRLWITLPLIPTGIYLLWSSQSTATFFLLPPILINVLLALLFGSTLLPGAKPIITQFAEIMRDELDADTRRYTEQVTVAWVIFFILMAIESALLALFAPPLIWSLFTNLINYLFLCLFFVVEYRIRIIQFTELKHPHFIDFIRSLAKINPKCIKTF